MHHRSHHGSFVADHAAAVVILILAMTFPMVNLASVAVRYSNLVGATHAAAHQGATASVWTSQPKATPPLVGIADAVPNTLTNYLQNAQGVHVTTKQWRINSAPIATGVVTHNAWNTKLAAAPDSNNLYTIEVDVQATVDPLVTFGTHAGFGIPGVTGPEVYNVSAQELVENINGLNN